MVFNRLVKGTSTRDAAATSAANDAVQVVTLDDELARLRPGLQRALGPGYLVAEGSPAGTAAAIGPARLARIEVLRAAHPQAFILVYDVAGNEPGPYLDAVADDYVAGASMAELAARVRAGLRRLGWQRTSR